MRWIAAIGLAGMALAGCDQTTNEDAPGEDVETAVRESGEPAPDATDEQAQDGDSGDSNQRGGKPSDGGTPDDDGGDTDDNPPGNPLPPAGNGLRFVGLWASNAANCENLAWRFSATRLETPAGSVCKFDDVDTVPGGYDIAATCTAEGPPTEDSIEIRFAESAQAMLFESNAVADAGLVYCGRG